MARRYPNILIFAIDSIRRDHMSCYGYPRLTTPYFDQLAAKGVLFENGFRSWRRSGVGGAARGCMC